MRNGEWNEGRVVAGQPFGPEIRWPVWRRVAMCCPAHPIQRKEEADTATDN
jgi:hypothetical protein